MEDTTELKQLFVGKELYDKSFMSCTPAPDALYLRRGVQLILNCKKGTQMAVLESGEEEVILQCGQKFVISDVQVDSDGTIKIYANSK